MIIAHQHGSERTTSEAALLLLEELVTSDDPVVANILKELTVYVMPRLNVDNGEPGRWTYCNHDPNSPPAWDEFMVSGRYPTGWNPSRYHALNWEDHPLSKYEEPALDSGKGFVPGKSFDNSVDYDGIEGLIIDCSTGYGPEAFPAEVKGNIALVERGAGDFDQIALWAYEAGAVAIIFYQDKDYEYKDQENFLPKFAFKGEVPIPGMTIPRQDAFEFMFRGETHARIFKNTYPENPVPEAQAVVDAVKKVKPIWFIDVHNTTSVLSPTGRTATAALSWGGRVGPELPQQVVDDGKRLCIAMADKMHETYEYAEVIKYYAPTWRNWPTTTLAYAWQLHIPTVLIELWTDFTPTYAPVMTRHGMEKLMVALEKTADGTLADIDPRRIDEIHEWGAGTTGAIARQVMDPIYMASIYKEELEATVAMIETLPEADLITFKHANQVVAARESVAKLGSLGIVPRMISNYRKLLDAEERLEELQEADWFTEESIFNLDVPGPDQRKGLAYFITYDMDNRWTSNDTINGASFSPLKMYTVGHANLRDPRWITYDISDRDFDFVEGYVGIIDRSGITTRPLDFEIFIDDELAFEARLEYREEAIFYRLDIKDAKTITFQWSAETDKQYANRIGLVEPLFITVDRERAIASAEDAIAQIPTDLVGAIDLEPIARARAIVDQVAAFGLESEISNLSILLEAEKVVKR